MATYTTGLTITSSYGSWYFSDLPVRADQASSDRLCIEKGYVSGGTYASDGGRFSNDGARLMNYWGSIDTDPTSGTTIQYYWMNLYSYDGIITSVTEP